MNSIIFFRTCFLVFIVFGWGHIYAQLQTSESFEESIQYSTSRINELVLNNNYRKALYESVILKQFIVDQFVDSIKVVFPQRYLGYILQDANDAEDDPFLSESSVNLFNLVYQHPDNGMVTISLLQHDPSIEEYQVLIKNPALFEKLGNDAEIITLRGAFPSILKYELDQHYVEYNILVRMMFC